MVDPFIYKYPFSEEARDFIKELKLFPKDIPKRHPHVLKKVLKRFRELIDDEPLTIYKSETEVLVYITSNLILTHAHSKWLDYKYVELLGKEFTQNIITETNENILKLANDTYQLNLVEITPEKIGRKIHIYALPFNDYLRITAKLSNPYFKLVNRNLNAGLVTLSKMDTRSMIEEAFHVDFYAKLKKFRKIESDVKTFELELQELVDQVKLEASKVDKRRDSIPIVKVKAGIETYPPCINHLINELKEGRNLEHQERLVLLFFLRSADVSNQEMMELFSLSPDFKESMTKYMVSHAEGKKYISYGCRKIESFGLCRREEDRWCNEREARRIKNPLVYMSRKAWYFNQKRTEKEKEKVNFDFLDDYME